MMSTYRVHVRVDNPDTPGRAKQLPTEWVDAPDESTAAAKVASNLAMNGVDAQDIVSAVAVLETN